MDTPKGYRKVTDIKELKLGTVIYWRDKHGSRLAEHTIRKRVVTLNKDGSESKRSETVEEYQDYRKWFLQALFERGNIFVKDDN